MKKKDIIPKIYKGCITDVIESGECGFSSLTKRVRPVTGGYVIGLNNTNIYGTYGAMVMDNKYFYMLSNNHIMADLNKAQIGSEILQPAFIYSGRSPKDTVATLSNYIPLYEDENGRETVNYVDAAIAKVTNLSSVSSFITFVGTPKGIIEPQLDMMVEMVGCISGYTNGRIKYIGATIKIVDEGKTFTFVDQIICNADTVKGDSGALVLTIGGEAVGLMFGSFNNSEYTAFNSINTVLSSLQVKLVTS